MANVYVSKRKKALQAALKKRDIEALYWWVVEEHKEALLSGERSHLDPGLFRQALEHLARLQMKRGTVDDEESEKAAAELEQALRLVE